MSDARKRKLQASLNKSSELPESLRFVPSSEPPTNGPHAKKQRTNDISSTTTPRVFDTHLLNLQAEQLVKSVRRKPGTDDNLTKLVSSITRLIQAIPDQEPLKLSDARKLSKRCGVALPFDPVPPEDLQINFQYDCPDSIEEGGLSSIRAHSRTASPEAELFIELPKSIIQEKDYLNNRIHFKAAYYLFTIARSMKSKYEVSYEQRTLFGVKSSVLLVEYKQRRVVISLCLSMDSFEDHKLMPDKNAIRSIEGPSPQYNASVLTMTRYNVFFTTLTQTSETSPGFRDSLLLAERYLSKRSLNIRLDQWALTTASLLSGGGKNGGKVLSPNASALQLFRGTVLFLSQFFAAPDASVSFGDSQPHVGCWVRGFDLFSNLSDQDKALLAHEFNLAVARLSDDDTDSIKAFETVFLDDHRYIGAWDLEIRISSEQLDATDIQRMWRTLKKALGDRAILVNVSKPDTHQLVPVSETLRDATTGKISIGLLLKRPACQSTMVLGPPASSPDAASFRSFWGILSELRKFKDGRILESVLLSKSNPCLDICQKILGLHFPTLDAIEEWSVFGTDFADNQALLSQQQALAAEFDEFARIARDLDDLPLRITDIASADPVFAGCASSLPSSIEASLQFESSARWPDDLEAIQRTKIAFTVALQKSFSNIPGVVSAGVVLENQSSTEVNFSSVQSIVNVAVLRVVMTSQVSYNIRIHFDREYTLLTTYLKSAIARADQQSRNRHESALKLYQTTFLVSQTHMQYIRNVASKYSAYSEATILLKQWFSAHLLTSYFSDRTLELIGLYIFSSKHELLPQSPSSAFLRTMRHLAIWDWRQEPMILSEDLDIRKENSKVFDQLKVQNPGHSAMIYTPYSASDIAVERVAALRMTSLAKATHIELQNGKSVPQTMTTPLHQFDFVIALKDDRKVSKYKNINTTGSQLSLLKTLFKQELQEIYGHSLWLFMSPDSDTIGALIEPALLQPRKYRPNLGYPTKPVKSEEGLQVVVDVSSMLSEIQRLGGDLVLNVISKVK
ncbi:Pre-rRNA processing protein Utp22 [Taphrina deformans PYCC 5710]|uniref:U3 small nucleolar RNA-associated protein 22 n=1 Tax=Taphrina deformans (strain PYCC 5710 / ATCC 11124 / CBS 356.35 / IMI 108563 / JCM 9778 / NBRC 8474) TaxID=1097556 RepID=R4XGM3_TAPDE|nr:Pre-rRNA processing protein Utp22 [Taphrina deformans PYCC 5710]|eukprot:CCG82519.1 Pre-rRNA processing protein Utp22 [Taphrina deformans PYCC 5710]